MTNRIIDDMAAQIKQEVDMAVLQAGQSNDVALEHIARAIKQLEALRYQVWNSFHVSGKVDPIADIGVIDTELALADLGTVDKALQRYSKAAKSGNDKEAAALVAVLTKVQAQLDQALPVRAISLSKEELALLKPFCLITAKPAMYVANVKEDGFENNPHLEAVKQHAAKENAPVVAVCAAIEAEIADLEDADKVEFLADLGMSEPGLNRVIRAGYSLLGLQTYFTAGVRGACLDHSYWLHE